MILAGFASILVTVVLLGMLGHRDPKRLRNLAQHGASTLEAFSAPVRRGFALLTLLPGCALIWLGQWEAFLIWLGASCVLGWGTTMLWSKF